MTFTVSDHPAVHDARTQPEEKRYKVAKAPLGPEMSFDERTPDHLCQLLARLNVSRERVLLVYGDVETGAIWKSATPERGRIGRSTGPRKIPLLVRTSRSMGGEAILDDSILEVRESVGGKVIYTRPGITPFYKKDEDLPELPFTD